MICMFPKIGVPHNGKPHFLMDDLGENPTIFGNAHMVILEHPCNQGQDIRVKIWGFVSAAVFDFGEVG